MIVPKEFELVKITSEEAKVLVDELTEFKGSFAYEYLNKMLGGIAWLAYSKLSIENTIEDLKYAQGVLGGLEMMTQNFEKDIEEARAIVKQSEEREALMEGKE